MSILHGAAIFFTACHWTRTTVLSTRHAPCPKYGGTDDHDECAIENCRCIHGRHRISWTIIGWYQRGITAGRWISFVCRTSASKTDRNDTTFGYTNARIYISDVRRIFVSFFFVLFIFHFIRRKLTLEFFDGWAKWCKSELLILQRDVLNI